MATTLDDLDRRVTALERASETEKNIIRAVSEIVDESEKRVTAQMEDLQAETAKLRTGIENRLSGIEDRIAASEKRVIAHFDGVLDRIMVKLDPPKP